MTKKKITTTFDKGVVVTAAMMMDVLSSGNPDDEVRIENTWGGKVMRVTLISEERPEPPHQAEVPPGNGIF